MELYCQPLEEYCQPLSNGTDTMNRLSLQDRARILNCLVEGNSMRATSRMCDVSRHTVTKLLTDVGSACAEYQDKVAAARVLVTWASSSLKVESL